MEDMFRLCSHVRFKIPHQVRFILVTESIVNFPLCAHPLYFLLGDFLLLCELSELRPIFKHQIGLFVGQNKELQRLTQHQNISGSNNLGKALGKQLKPSLGDTAFR